MGFRLQNLGSGCAGEPKLLGKQASHGRQWRLDSVGRVAWASEEVEVAREEAPFPT